MEPKYQYLGQTQDDPSSVPAVTRFTEMSNKEKRDLLLALRKTNDERVSQTLKAEHTFPNLNKSESLPIIALKPQVSFGSPHPKESLQIERIKSIQLEGKVLAKAEPVLDESIQMRPQQWSQKGNEIPFSQPLSVSTPKLKHSGLLGVLGPTSTLPILQSYHLVTG